MLYIFIGFAFGFAIPYLARRFAKFMPATFAYAIYRILKPNKNVSKQKRKQNLTYKKLCLRYFMRSLGWGIVTSSVIFLLSLTAAASETPWLIFLIITLFILMEIDKRMFLLPDILTVPLLIVGFLYAAFSGYILGFDAASSTLNSALGAFAGYFIPVLASLFLIKKYPDAFGGGDIKLLAAVGAWLGLTNIPYIILLSCLIFAATCFINKQKIGAFGPSIVIATLIILFLNIY